MNEQRKKKVMKIFLSLVLVYGIGLFYALVYEVPEFIRPKSTLEWPIFFVIAPLVAFLFSCVGELVGTRLLSKEVGQGISSKSFSILRILYAAVGVLILFVVGFFLRSWVLNM